jgi:hypothetical protein
MNSRQDTETRRPGDKEKEPRRPSPGLLVPQSPGLVFWTGGIAAAVLLGRVSAMLSVAGKAPAGLLSMGIGLALGMLLIALAELLHVKARRELLVAAVVLAAVTVVAEHAWLYRAYRQQWWRNRVEQPAVALFRPEATPLSLPAYFQREIEYSPRQWLFWSVDAVLIVAGAWVVVRLKQRSEGVATTLTDEATPAG